MNRPSQHTPLPQTHAAPAADTATTEPPRRNRRARWITPVAGTIVVVAILAIIFAANDPSTVPDTSPGDEKAEAGQYTFAVGSPRPGAQAPPIRLPATDGSTFDLSKQRGETTLLYFQEGVMCQPCWEQIKDIESTWPQFERAGIDQIVTITTDPMDALRRKASDENLRMPVASDVDVAVSRSYDANEYTMMGDNFNGHSFVLIGDDGTIKWRADYGGAPDYTMYLPVANLLADIRAGTEGT